MDKRLSVYMKYGENRILVQFLSLYVQIIFIGWLVGCFWFNGPLRQYFSLYRAVYQREGERVGWLVVMGLTAL